MKKNDKTISGFTMIEMLSVLVIIAILMGIVLGLSAFARRKAYEARAMAQLERLKTALEEYKFPKGACDVGCYPADADFNYEELSFFVSDLPHDDDGNIIDPWGELYVYTSDTCSYYKLFSKGHDREAGTGDDLY